MLSLGPKIDDNMMHQMQINAAKCAYKLKWNQPFEGRFANQETELTEKEPEPKRNRVKISFNSLFFTTPQTDNTLLEAELSSQFTTSL